MKLDAELEKALAEWREVPSHWRLVVRGQLLAQADDARRAGDLEKLARALEAACSVLRCAEEDPK